MTREPPIWLPGKASLHGLQNEVIDRLYRVFCNDLRDAQLRFRGLPIVWDTRMVSGASYEEGFWHLVSREVPGTKTRQFDPNRAALLPWCAAVITNAHDSEVRVWNYRKSRKLVRTYLWLEDWDYVVVLQERTTQTGPVVVLITAYHIDGPWTRRQFERMYAKRTR